MNEITNTTETAIDANTVLCGVILEKIDYKLIKPKEGQAVRLFLNPWKNNPIMDMIWHADNCQYDDWNMVEYWSPLTDEMWNFVYNAT